MSGITNGGNYIVQSSTSDHTFLNLKNILDTYDCKVYYDYSDLIKNESKEIKTIMPIKSDSEYTFKSTTENVDLDRIIRESKGQDFILVKIEEKDANAKVRYEFFVSKKILDHPAINFDSLHKSPLLGGHIAGFYARRDWGRSMEDYNAPKSEFNNSYRRASKSFSNTTPNV